MSVFLPCVKMCLFFNQCICIILIFFTLNYCDAENIWITTDELENCISPEDYREFFKIKQTFNTSSNDVYANSSEDIPTLPTEHGVDCFGLKSLSRHLPWLFSLEPDSSEKVNTQFYFSSRLKPTRIQVFSNTSDVRSIDFKAKRKTIVIVHGFMSYSNATWVVNMTGAFLYKFDVNVITVDWSGGGNTWKYWKAAANTRRVGSDMIRFIEQLINVFGAKVKDFHLIGHSLGAHICSYVSFHIGGVSRITGLDPAQPCFQLTDGTERLDKSDADFVDIIHTNGRLLSKIGFGLPEVLGHADFYPNGGLIQPGCFNRSRSLLSRFLPYSNVLEQAICSHGRAYLLFTESLMNHNCSFKAYSWDLTYESIDLSLQAACNRVIDSCSVMGIGAVGDGVWPRAKGPYFVLTDESAPYCPTEAERRHPNPELLEDLRKGFRYDRAARQEDNVTRVYVVNNELAPTPLPPITTTKSWFWRIFG